MRREQHWIAALAIAQLGIAIAVFGIALVRDDGSGILSGAARWPALSVPLACVLGGAVLVGVALGALGLSRAWRHGAEAAEGGTDAESLPTVDAYMLTQDAALKQLAATPGGDPFWELLRPMVQLDAVQGAAFSTRDGLTLSARLPQELGADEVSSLAPTLLATGPEWLLDRESPGAEEDVNIRHGARSLVVMARGPIVLSAMLDEAAGANGASRHWLQATAAAGAKLWTARYGTPSQMPTTLQ